MSVKAFVSEFASYFCLTSAFVIVGVFTYSVPPHLNCLLSSRVTYILPDSQGVGREAKSANSNISST